MGSNLWAVAPLRSYDHMTCVAREARNLLGALGANVDWLKSVLPEQPPVEELADGLSDIETCCERLRDLLEDALIGTRKDGLSVTRTLVSVESTLNVCVRQVRRRADARQVNLEILGGELYAMLDGSLLMRAIVKLLDQVIRHGERGTRIQIRYGLENGEIRLTFAKLEPNVRSIAPPSLRPPNSWRPARPSVAAGAVDPGDLDDLEFCHVAAEAHGGTLVVGGAALFRMTLPWVDSTLQR